MPSKSCGESISREIADLSQARAEHEQVADDLTRLIDTANAPIIGIDALGRINQWNQTAARLTGFSKAEVLNKNLVDEFITANYKASVREVLDKALVGEETSNYEFPLFTKSGKRVDILFNSTTRRDASGQVVGVVGVGQNITDLAQTRAEHERVADDLTRLIDTANAPIIGIDALGRVNEWNQTAARLTGFSKTEALNRNLVDEFVADDYKASVREVLDKALMGEETSNYEFLVKTKAGKRLHILLNATSRRAKDQTIVGVIGIGEDITTRLAQEMQLRQRATLEAIGGVTGGIAHDFNNLLTVVTGNLSLLIPRDQEEKEILDDAMKAARDGSALVRNLLSFSRQQSLVPRAHSVHRILEDFQRSLARTLGESITVEVSTEEEDLAIFVDRSQFEAALLNVCINARDAMASNGRIRIESFRREPSHDDELMGGIGAENNEDFVCIRVIDNGSGMEPALLEKVTDPYFTTKQVGEGSGLGLGSVAGFVEQSGGSMRIFSELGEGTTVELLLPSSRDTATAEEGAIRPSATGRTTRTSRATVLAVDDEPKVLKLAVRWLKREGYDVIQAKNGDEALACLERRMGRIDVLFSDIVMPGKLNGRALAEEVSARYPWIAIQLATGFDQAREHRGIASEPQPFPVLSKPYSLADLSDSIGHLARKQKDRDLPRRGSSASLGDPAPPPFPEAARHNVPDP